MSDTATLADITMPVDEHYLVAEVESGSGAYQQASAAQTTFFNRLLSKVELVMLPMSVAASFSGPALGGEYQRSIVRSKASRSVLRLEEWGQDRWIYTEETATVAEIRALNELLALPAAEGMWIDLDRD